MSSFRFVTMLLFLLSLSLPPCRAQDLCLGCVFAEAFDKDIPAGIPHPNRDGPMIVVAGAIEPGPASGRLQMGDIIISVDEKPITNRASFSEAHVRLVPETDTKIKFLRFQENAWKKHVTTIKPTKQDDVIVSAMKPRKSETDRDVVIYEYGGLQPWRETFILNRVMEKNGNYLLGFCILHAKDWPPSETIVLESDAGSFEIRSANIRQEISGDDGYPLKMEYCLLDNDELDKLANAVSTSTVSVRFESGEKSKVHTISNQEWIGINIAIRFCKIKSSHRERDDY